MAAPTARFRAGSRGRRYPHPSEDLRWRPRSPIPFHAAPRPPHRRAAGEGRPGWSPAAATLDRRGGILVWLREDESSGYVVAATRGSSQAARAPSPRARGRAAVRSTDPDRAGSVPVRRVYRPTCWLCTLAPGERVLTALDPSPHRRLHPPTEAAVSTTLVHAPSRRLATYVSNLRPRRRGRRSRCSCACPGPVGSPGRCCACPSTGSRPSPRRTSTARPSTRLAARRHPVENPVVNYRWLLDGVPGGYQWLNGEGVHARDVTDAADFRITTPPGAAGVGRVTRCCTRSSPTGSPSRSTARHPTGRSRRTGTTPSSVGGPQTPRQYYGGDLDGMTPTWTTSPPSGRTPSTSRRSSRRDRTTATTPRPSTRSTRCSAATTRWPGCPTPCTRAACG